jgi:hypothetical protein
MSFEAAVRARRQATHCAQGHPFSGENLVVCADGKRRCRTCRQKRDRTSDNEKRRQMRGSWEPKSRAKRDSLSRLRIPPEPLFAHLRKRGLLFSDFHPSIEMALSRAKANGYISFGYVDDIAGPVLNVHPHAIYGWDWFTFGTYTVREIVASEGVGL